MSDAVLIAIIVAVPTTLTVLLTWWAGESKRRDQNRETNAKLSVIHKVANSRLTKALSEIEKLRGELRGARTTRKGPR